MAEQRRGFLYGLAAYALWGFFPIYFHALRPAGPVEILAHRVIWSLLMVALLLAVLRQWRRVAALLRRPKVLAAIALAAVLVGTNWGIYIYGVNSGHVVETSLGYFINPLVSVLFGLTVFAERLRRWQWVALGIGAAAVVVLTLDYGQLPWIALSLALTFGSYTMIKKRLGLPPADGLFLESAVLVLPALAYLTVLASRGQASFGTVSAGHTTLMVLAGVMTAGPLMLFASAANRLPLTSLGLMQYLTPVLQLITGVFLFHEPMPPARLAGFALVWLALVVFTWDVLREPRRAGSPAALARAARAARVAAGRVPASGGVATAGGVAASGGVVAQDDRAVALAHLDRADVGGS